MKAIISVIALMLGITIYGCASNKELRTINGYNNDVTSKNVDGINIITKVNYWKGNPEIKQYVTPVYVTINNNSNKQLKISYEQFSLISSKGERFAALPPFGVTGEVSRPALLQQYSPILVPGFTYRGFLIAPFYSSIYPEIPVFDEEFYFDPLYYSNYYNYWDQVQYDLPTPKMIDNALPEGVLKKGGEISGFIYFEKINNVKSNNIDFKADLINSKTGNNFAVISIPFSVVNE